MEIILEQRLKNTMYIFSTSIIRLYALYTVIIFKIIKQYTHIVREENSVLKDLLKYTGFFNIGDFKLLRNLKTFMGLNITDVFSHCVIYLLTLSMVFVFEKKYFIWT